MEIKFTDELKINVVKEKNSFHIDGQLFDGEVERINEHTYKVVGPTKIHTVELVDSTGNELALKINNKFIQVKATDHIDQMLEKLGMSSSTTVSLKEIKAPMPGSILNVVVNVGDSVAAGDQLLVLEAMKMEKVIKSPGEGVVSKIHISEKDSVEKNQVLISFE